MQGLSFSKNQNVFKNYKFKASSVGFLMVEPRSKNELFSETTLSYLSEIYLELFYGRKKELEGDAILKGLDGEKEAIELISKFLEIPLKKNETYYSNDYFVGIPDLITNDWVGDVKVADSIFTFPKFKFKDKLDDKSFFDDSKYRNYYWQLQVYMDLVEVEEARLFYVLVNSPDWFLTKQEKYKMYELLDRGFDGLDLEIEMEKYRNTLRINYCYDDLDVEDRVYEVVIKKNKEGLSLLKNKIDYIRNCFLDSYKLG